ncbi:FAD-dependent monooxygenase [Nonomuraea sediminis]|uniref:FAD-dependent monooxygenase n=1 Tax=Nonomuraea sediminis TaxID=2835864 RepID=UPI001BDC7860|nr:FAD-dependent monooxygenase [Nonomuraea sediminis]
MKTVLISGAGIAGPALAFWLHRYGWQPTIVERAPVLRVGGQAVDFRGTPQLQVLDRMGLLPAIRDAQTGMGAIAIVNEAGAKVSSLPTEAFSGDVEILRGDLGRILYEATRDTTEYLFGDSIAAMEETPQGVEVVFDSGATRRFDLVAGADGTRSRVRALALRSELLHLGMSTAIFTTPNTFGLDREGLMYSAPGRSATILGLGADAKVMLDFASPEISQEVDHRALVAHQFSCDRWKVPGLLEAMWRADDFYFDTATQVAAEHYSAGRIVLVGDAGYGPGPGGMGTGLAVIGAYTLAGELAAHDHHTAAFEAYERRLRPYVQICHKQAKGGEKFLVPRKRSQIWMRNQTMRLMPYLPLKKMMAKGANAITLESYG